MIRAERLRLGLTQQQVADLVPISVETIRKYECGARSPNSLRLRELLTSMKVPQLRERAILNAAGFIAAQTLFPSDANPSYYPGEAEARAEIERSPWPKFVVNNLMELVAANRATLRLWDVEPGFELSGRTRAQLNLLTIMAGPRVAHHLANLDACLAEAAANLKGLLERDRQENRMGRLRRGHPCRMCGW
jgi:transcriptional regulator with XRE-family HTH domain